MKISDYSYLKHFADFERFLTKQYEKWDVISAFEQKWGWSAFVWIKLSDGKIYNERFDYVKPSWEKRIFSEDIVANFGVYFYEKDIVHDRNFLEYEEQQ